MSFMYMKIRNRTKIFSILLLLVTFIMAAAGCGSTDTETQTSYPASDNSDDSCPAEDPDTDSTDNSDSSDAADDLESGGGSGASSLDYQDIVAEYLTIILDYDGYGAQFDLALSAVGSYLDGTLSREDAEAEISSVCSALTESYNLALADYTVSDELSAALQEYGILPEEFEYFANLRAYQASEYLSDLDILENYLPYADDYDFEWEYVSFWHEIHSTLQDAYRGYYFYGSVNYWFAEWDKELTAYVQSEVIPCLESCIPETWVWETTQAAAEEKTMSYLDIVEECVEIQAEFLAESTEELNAQKRMLEDMK